MSKIIIRRLSTQDFSKWDSLVNNSPQGTIFHNSRWLQIAEKHSSSNLYLLVGYIGDEIIAGIPLFFIKRKGSNELFSPIGSGMIQHLGPVIKNYNDLKQNKREYYFVEFQKALDNYLNIKFKPKRVSIVTSPNLNDARPYIWNGYTIIPKYNYSADITELSTIWSGFKKELRKNILNAEKVNITIEMGGITEFKNVVESLSQRLGEQKRNLPVSMDYMLDLYNSFGREEINVMVANKMGKQVSGIIFTTYKDRISIWVGATKADIKGIYPVDLLQWKIMEWGNKNGFKYCDILGANMQTNSFFKSRYNFHLDPYFHVQKQIHPRNHSIIRKIIKKVAKIYN